MGMVCDYGRRCWCGLWFQDFAPLGGKCYHMAWSKTRPRLSLFCVAYIARFGVPVATGCEHDLARAVGRAVLGIPRVTVSSTVPPAAYVPRVVLLCGVEGFLTAVRAIFCLCCPAPSAPLVAYLDGSLTARLEGGGVQQGPAGGREMNG